MFIGYDFFNLEDGAVFDSQVPLRDINRIEVYNGLIDDIYVDEDNSSIFSTTKPSTWLYSTVLHAEFENTMEAGSVAAGGFTIDKIKLQKRQWNELEWFDVGELEYNPDDKLLYELYDKVIANDFVYQYSLIPVAANVIGNRVTSVEITAEFEGVFISDKENNYHLLYDAEVGDIAHVSPSTKFEPLGSKYPIVVYSETDYAEWAVNATFISAHTIADQPESQVNVRMQQADKQQLMNFMKNKKPKIYRDMHGNLKLVTLLGNPSEAPRGDAPGIATLGFTLIEIDSTDADTLRSYDLLAGEF